MGILKGHKILAVDDTDAIRTFLRISLEAQGATFYEADTATEGIKMAKELKPDLVVLDLGLPDRDGLEALPDIINGHNGTHSPAVLVLTVRKEPQTREIAIARGACAYLTKPFMMEDLVELINETLNNKLN